MIDAGGPLVTAPAESKAAHQLVFEASEFVLHSKPPVELSITHNFCPHDGTQPDVREA